MKEVLDMLERLDVSRPIFKVKKSTWRQDQYDLECVDKAVNAFAADNVLAPYVVAGAQEIFNRTNSKYEINIESSLESIKYKITSYLQKFISEHSDAKNPYLTKLHRWWSDRPQGIRAEGFNEACLATFKYLKAHEGTNDPTHIKNGLSILNILMSKYGEKDDIT
jgi:hypothetical protein